MVRQELCVVTARLDKYVAIQAENITTAHWSTE